MKRKLFVNGMKNAKTVDEFLKVIDDAESAKDGKFLNIKRDVSSSPSFVPMNSCETMHFHENAESVSDLRKKRRV